VLQQLSFFVISCKECDFMDDFWDGVVFGVGATILVLALAFLAGRVVFLLW
jgi:hypothetical protein